MATDGIVGAFANSEAIAADIEEAGAEEEVGATLGNNNEAHDESFDGASSVRVTDEVVTFLFDRRCRTFEFFALSDRSCNNQRHSSIVKFPKLLPSRMHSIMANFV